MRKKRDYRGFAGEGLIPYMTIFFAIGEGIGKMPKLLKQGVIGSKQRMD
jgi:hypothetical protein